MNFGMNFQCKRKKTEFVVNVVNRMKLIQPDPPEILNLLENDPQAFDAYMRHVKQSFPEVIEDVTRILT